MKQNEIIQNDRKTTLCIYTGKLKVKNHTLLLRYIFAE